MTACLGSRTKAAMVASPALSRRTLRHGPVPSGPGFGVDERQHIITHLRAIAERADRSAAAGLLLARQAYYLLGFDTSTGTLSWLAQMYRRDRQTAAGQGTRVILGHGHADQLPAASGVGPRGRAILSAWY